MFISVITSVYNEKKHIREMIESIISQTHTDWELIIIDDASTDGTWEIIKSYTDKRIVAINNEKNRGLTVNLNTAIKKSRGKYILRIDGDDIAYPRRFEKQIDYMECHPEIALSGCWMKTFGDYEEILSGWTDPEYMKMALLFNPVIYHPTFIIRKSFIDKYGIRYNEQLRYAQDFAFQYAVTQYGKLGVLEEVLMKYRIHINQISSGKKCKQYTDANATRMLQLKNLKIELNDQDFELWCRVVSGDLCQIMESDKKRILKIAGLIENSISGYDNLRKEISMFVKEKLESCMKEKRNFEDSNEADKILNNRLKYIFSKWIKADMKGDIKAYLEREKIKKVAIYGMGVLGKELLRCLRKENVEVSYCIDVNYSKIKKEDVMIYPPKKELQYVDLIIVTTIEHYTAIESLLKRIADYRVISLEDFLYSC